MRGRGPARSWLAIVGGLALCACTSEYPEYTRGARISGRVSYHGTAHQDIARPAAGVAAFFTFPPVGPPNAMVLLEDIDGLETGVAYELTDLAPYDYHVVAQLVDLDNQGDFSVPAGSFPDFCALSDGRGAVSVAENEAVSEIDIVIYDRAGADDPCGRQESACPEPGAAGVVLDVTAVATQLDPADILVMGLFAQWPPAAPPVHYKSFQPPDIAFPKQIRSGAVPAGSWVVYVCLDRGGDNVTSVCGDEDSWAVLDGGAPVTFDAGTIVELGLDLDTDEGTTPVVSDPADHMCQ